MMATIKDIDVVRLAGAAHRISNTSKEVDGDFLGRSGGAVARFVFGSKKEPAAAARELVSAGLIDKNNPTAVALQDPEVTAAARTMVSGPDMIMAATKQATEISKSTDHRDVRVSAAAMVRKLGQGKMSHQAAAVGFENIAQGAQDNGCHEAARQAGKASASITVAGTTLRNREIDARPRRKEAQME